jgi:predicted amidophosphoribosyltransferase
LGVTADLLCSQCEKPLWEATGEPDRDRCAACGTPARHAVEVRSPEEWAGIAEAAFVGSAKFEETGWDG